MRPAALAAALAALVFCSAAGAHGGGGALGFRSTVTRITPRVAGVSVTVLDLDDRLRLRNETDEPLLVLGYEGEPYLAFRKGHVYRNVHSPATYLNDDRYGEVALPPLADPHAPPVWEEVSGREVYEWHDHRIHWMSPTLPPIVQAARGTPHHVFDWTIPARFGGRPLTVSGSLDYQPLPTSLPRSILVVVLLVIGGGGASLWLRRRRRRAARDTVTVP